MLKLATVAAWLHSLALLRFCASSCACFAAMHCCACCLAVVCRSNQGLKVVLLGHFDLPAQVRLRVTARVINEMHAEEDVRRRVLQDDR